MVCLLIWLDDFFSNILVAIEIMVKNLVGQLGQVKLGQVVGHVFLLLRIYRGLNPESSVLTLCEKGKVIYIYALKMYVGVPQKSIYLHILKNVCWYLTKEHIFLAGLVSENGNRPQEVAFSEHRISK